MRKTQNFRAFCDGLTPALVQPLLQLSYEKEMTPDGGRRWGRFSLDGGWGDNCIQLSAR